MARKILSTLPDGYMPLPEGMSIRYGDFFLFGSKYIEVAEGSPYANKSANNFLNRTFFRHKSNLADPVKLPPSKEEIFIALVAYAKQWLDHAGEDFLRNFKNRSGPCCCSGPKNDEPLCGCAMDQALEENLTEVLLALGIKPKVTMTITVEKRSSDYMAYINGNTALWGSGSTPDDAIGNAIRSHRERMGIEIKGI